MHILNWCTYTFRFKRHPPLPVSFILPLSRTRLPTTQQPTKCYNINKKKTNFSVFFSLYSLYSKKYKNPMVINYHQKKTNDKNVICVQCYMTGQLPVKKAQCWIATNVLVKGVKWLKKNSPHKNFMFLLSPKGQTACSNFPHLHRCWASVVDSTLLIFVSPLCSFRDARWLGVSAYVPVGGLSCISC